MQEKETRMPDTLLETGSEIDLPSYPCAVPVGGCTPYADLERTTLTRNYSADPKRDREEGGGAGLSQSLRAVELGSHRVRRRWSRALREFEGGGAGLSESLMEVELGSHRVGGRWSWALTELEGGGAGLSQSWREVELGSHRV